MKNIIPIIILVVLVGGFLIFKNSKKENGEVVSENPTEETPSGNQTPGETTEQPGEETEPNYTYTNREFDFAVTLPGLVATAKGSADPIYKPYIFTFGVGDQSSVPEEKRIPNTMAVYVWKNKAEFQLLVSQMNPIGTETIHGHKFDIYEITEGPRTSYRYTTTVGTTLYDVGLWNRADAQKFYLLK